MRILIVAILNGHAVGQGKGTAAVVVVVRKGNLVRSLRERMQPVGAVEGVRDASPATWGGAGLPARSVIRVRRAALRTCILLYSF